MKIGGTSFQNNFSLYYKPPSKSMYEKSMEVIQQPALYNQNQNRYKQENRVSHVTMDDPEHEALKAITMRRIFDHMLQSHMVQIKFGAGNT